MSITQNLYVRYIPRDETVVFAHDHRKSERCVVLATRVYRGAFLRLPLSYFRTSVCQGIQQRWIFERCVPADSETESGPPLWPRDSLVSLDRFSLKDARGTSSSLTILRRRNFKLLNVAFFSSYTFFLHFQITPHTSEQYFVSNTIFLRFICKLTSFQLGKLKNVPFH